MERLTEIVILFILFFLPAHFILQGRIYNHRCHGSPKSYLETNYGWWKRLGYLPEGNQDSLHKNVKLSLKMQMKPILIILVSRRSLDKVLEE
jgi:hypothetical protein